MQVILIFIFDFQEEEYEQTQPGKGAQTSTFYKVGNIPERFDKPGMII